VNMSATTSRFSNLPAKLLGQATHVGFHPFDLLTCIVSILRPCDIDS
jgi:hypothetical protein